MHSENEATNETCNVIASQFKKRMKEEDGAE